jgi:hypothetical protein
MAQVMSSKFVFFSVIGETSSRQNVVAPEFTHKSIKIDRLKGGAMCS